MEFGIFKKICLGKRMLSKNFKKSLKEIKSLKVQGASEVRKAAIKALASEISGFSSKSVMHFKADLLLAVKELCLSRPTEPEMRTALRVVLHKVQGKEAESVEKLRKELLGELLAFERQRQEAMRKIAIYGARSIPPGSVVLTHCHSHTVMEILKEAFRQGRLERVYFTETRPLFQGRITALELSKAGIPATMILDSAAAGFLKKCSLFLTGADAILSDGSLVNKIGTQGISMLAESFGVQHFAACSSHKFDPATVFGFEEVIEQRPESEVWGKKLKKLRIENPAFDVTPAKYVKALITEKGILPPTEFAGLMYEELRLDKHEKEFASLIRLMKK